MRTKALLCAAGMLAAGAATCMAQGNVYSLNVVGYINVSYTNKFQMVANQLDLDGSGTNNTVQTVFGTNVPSLTTVYTFTPGSGYASATLIGANWNTGTAANTALVNHGLDVGRGVWLQIPAASPTPGTFTEVGNVFQGSKSGSIATGFNMVSEIAPVSQKVQTVAGYPAANGDTVYFFRQPAGYTGNSFTHIGTGTVWSPSEPSPNIGEAFWIQRAAAAGATTWTQNFTVP